MTSADSRIIGNYVGTDVTGTVDLGNDAGIKLADATGVLIGGTATGAGNLISGNVNGVIIDGSAATDNRVQGNTIGADTTLTFTVEGPTADLSSPGNGGATPRAPCPRGSAT